MAETAAPPAPRYVYDLRNDPDFPVLPPEQKMRRIVDLADKDPHFMSMSAKGRQEIVDELLGGGNPYTAQASAPAPEAPALQEGEVRALIEPAQEGGVQRLLQGRTQRDMAPGPEERPAATGVPMPLQVLQGTGQGLAQSVDEGLMAIPNLVQAGVMPAVEAGLNLLGREPSPPEPGSTRSTVLRTLQRPLETLMAGPEGFPVLDEPARTVQDIIRQTGGVTISSRLANQLVPALKDISLTDAVVQSLFGTAGKRIGEQSDSPWGPVLGELGGALGGQLGKDGLMALWDKLKDLPTVQAKKALGTVVRQTDPNILNDHIAVAKRLEGLVPGLRLTPFQAADTPELQAIQQALEQQAPELAQELRGWRLNNQKLMHQAFGEKMGEGGMAAADASRLAIEGLRAPYQQKQQLFEQVLAQNTANVAKAEADLQNAQGMLATTEGLGGQAKTQATEQVRLAQQSVNALKEQQQRLRVAQQEHQLAFAQDRAGLLAAAEQTAAGNMPATPMTYTERLQQTTRVWRDLFEKRFKVFRDEATRQSDLIDPQRTVAYPVRDLEQRLTEQRQRFQSEGLPIPSALGDIQEIIDQARLKQGGAAPGGTASQPVLPGLQAPTQADTTTLSMQDLRNARSRLLEDTRRMPYGTRERTFAQEMDRSLQAAMDDAAATAGDPGILKRYQDFATFYAQGIGTFVDGPGEVLLKADYLPKGGRPGTLLPEDYYHLTHGEVLGHLWSNAPIAGATGRGAEKFFQDFTTLASELSSSPAGKQALLDFATQDFYEKVVDQTTREFSPTKAAAWMRDHQAQLAAVPELQAAFATPQLQLQQVAQAERQSAKLLDQLRGQRVDIARQSVEAQSGQVAPAKEAARLTQERVTSDIESAKVGVEQASGVLTQVKRTATEQATQAEAAVKEALRDWQDAFGTSRAATYALQRNAVTDALGATPEDLLAQVNALPPNQRAFALGRLTEPIKNDPQAVAGLRKALWDSYVDTHTDKLVDPQLVKDLPLAAPQLVMDWLRDYQGWFVRYSSTQHYSDLMTIARGMKMNSMVAAAGQETVPTALKQMSAWTRTFYDLGIGSAALGTSFVTGVRSLFGLGTIVGGGSAATHFWTHMSDGQRLELLRHVTFDPDVAHVLSLANTGKADPAWLRTALYHELTKLGISGAARGSQIADVVTQPATPTSP